MPRRMQVPLPIQSAADDARPWSQQALVNAYIEAADGGAMAQARVRRCAGLTLFSDTTSTAGVRGVKQLNGLLYAVIGTALYSISSTGVATALPGASISGTGPVSIDKNRTQLGIVTSAGDGYIYTVGVNSVTLISGLDSDWLPATSINYFDDRGVYVREDSEEYFISALTDFSNLNALEFASAEKGPDKLVTALADHGELWLFSEDTIEVWYNAGLTDFPFARIDGGVIERGCAARFGVTKEDNTVFWIGDDRTIYRARGYEPSRISTHAIEAEIAAMSDVSDCVAFSWSESGHKFVCFTFPTGGKSFTFDAATGRWHERRSGVANAAGVWRCRSVEECYGQTLFGDASTGKIYKLDTNAYDEAGEAIEWIATTLPLYNGEQRIFYSGLDVNLDVGRGLTTGQGSDPQIMLSFSDDGGWTFGYELTRSMGKRGEYGHRIRFNRLGQARERVFRLSVTDAVPVTLIDMRADIEVGAA